jgi:hypothetical protein
MKHICGPIILLLEGGSIHRGSSVRIGRPAGIEEAQLLGLRIVREAETIVIIPSRLHHTYRPSTRFALSAALLK